jgi:methionine synthase I (cobalamin-dependent)
VLLCESLKDLNNLLDAFTFAENNFRETGAQRPMMIKPRVAQVFKWQITQPIESAFNCARSSAHFI